LVELGGSRGNNFCESVLCNTNSEVTDYEPITRKVNAMFASIDQSHLDDPQEIVDTIYALATHEGMQFRTLVRPVGRI
jgi:hypothetical protein